jgi:hypothetical protein
MTALQKMYSLLPSGVRARVTSPIKSAMRNVNVTRVSPGFLMDLDPGEWLQNHLRRGDGIEPATIKLFSQILKSGDTYVDVGAHVGYQTLVARHYIGAEGRVIAIDPQPYNCAKILTNWSLNSFGNIVAYPAAASDEERFITLQDQPAKDRSRLSLEGVSVSIPRQSRGL